MVTLLTLLVFFPHPICLYVMPALTHLLFYSLRNLFWPQYSLENTYIRWSILWTVLPRAQISRNVGQQGNMFLNFFLYWKCNRILCSFAQSSERYLPNASCCWGFKGILPTQPIYLSSTWFIGPTRLRHTCSTYYYTPHPHQGTSMCYWQNGLGHPNQKLMGAKGVKFLAIE